jgi:hypothetical protein
MIEERERERERGEDNKEGEENKDALHHHKSLKMTRPYNKCRQGAVTG